MKLDPHAPYPSQKFSQQEDEKNVHDAIKRWRREQCLKLVESARLEHDRDDDTPLFALDDVG